MTERTDLIARLEAAPTGSRELDGEIALSLGWKKWGRGWAHWVSPQGRTNQQVPFFSDSLDAALTSVPDNTKVCFINIKGFGHNDNACGPSAGVWHEGMTLASSGDCWSGKTPALAVCIAAMRAIQP